MPPVAPSPPPRRGFTLVEVLLVLALMALLASLLVPGVNSMLRAMDERAPEQLAAEAVLAARAAALESGRTVELRYDKDGRAFVWGPPDARSAALPAGTVAELLPAEAGGAVLLGGVLTETAAPLRRVRFFPDGTCDPFRLRLRESEAAAPRVLVADPWTCALSPVAAKGRP
jgi:type II secretion system protein H